MGNTNTEAEMNKQTTNAKGLVGSKIESDVGLIPVVKVQGGQILATRDGQDIDRSSWCECDSPHRTVFYTVRGTSTGGSPMLDNRLAHGWACGGCRKLAQVG